MDTHRKLCYSELVTKSRHDTIDCGERGTVSKGERESGKEEKKKGKLRASTLSICDLTRDFLPLTPVGSDSRTQGPMQGWGWVHIAN